jgi:hypothetical protein
MSDLSGIIYADFRSGPATEGRVELIGGNMAKENSWSNMNLV